MQLTLTEGTCRNSRLGGSHVQCEMTAKYLLDIQGSQLDTGAYSLVQHKVIQLGDDFKSMWLIDICFLFY